MRAGSYNRLKSMSVTSADNTGTSFLMAEPVSTPPPSTDAAPGVIITFAPLCLAVRPSQNWQRGREKRWPLSSLSPGVYFFQEQLIRHLSSPHYSDLYIFM